MAPFGVFKKAQQHQRTRRDTTSQAIDLVQEGDSWDKGREFIVTAKELQRNATRSSVIEFANQPSEESANSREFFPTKKDELCKEDVLQFKLINAIAFFHAVAILSSLVMFNVGWDPEIVDWRSSEAVEICKIIISICTVIASLCTIIVRNKQLKEEKRKKKQKDGFPCGLIFENIIILLHVPPFTARFAGWLDTCNILVFARVYIIYELIRVYSPVWRLRRINFNARGEQCRVSGLYHFKYLMNDDPLKFFLCSSIVLMTFMAVSMQVLERWEQPELDFRLCIYYMIVVFTSVGLGDIYCLTMLGKLLTLVAAVGGFVFLSISVGFIFEAIEMEESEMEIKENHLNILALIEYRSFAAKIIQRAYRRYRTKKRGEKSAWVEALCHHSNNFLLASFAEASEAIKEKKNYANKQTVSHVVRVTQTHVEKILHDVEVLLERLSLAPKTKEKPAEDTPATHYTRIQKGIRKVELRTKGEQVRHSWQQRKSRQRRNSRQKAAALTRASVPQTWTSRKVSNMFGQQNPN